MKKSDILGNKLTYVENDSNNHLLTNYIYVKLIHSEFLYFTFYRFYGFDLKQLKLNGL